VANIKEKIMKIKLFTTSIIIALATTFGANVLANQVNLKNNATYPITIYINDGSTHVIKPGEKAALGDHIKLLARSDPKVNVKISTSTLDNASNLDIISLIKEAQKQKEFIQAGRALNLEVTPGLLYGWKITLPGWF
jgi:hypothetical protein